MRRFPSFSVSWYHPWRFSGRTEWLLFLIYVFLTWDIICVKCLCNLSEASSWTLDGIAYLWQLKTCFEDSEVDQSLLSKRRQSCHCLWKLEMCLYKSRKVHAWSNNVCDKGTIKASHDQRQPTCMLSTSHVKAHPLWRLLPRCIQQITQYKSY